MDIREQLLAAVGKSRLSERKLSVLATGSTDTIRNIRRGAVPRVDTLESLCEVLGLRLHIGLGLIQPEEETAPGPQPPTTFSESRQLPVYQWAEPSEQGYLRRGEESNRAPAPVDLTDELAFYVRMPDETMAPARIWRNDYCLISPCAQLRVDQRAWFRGQTGRETLKWVVRLSAGGYDVGAWALDEGGHQKPVAVHWTPEDIVDRGPVLAVYREEPCVTKPVKPVADWRPDSLAEVWRLGLFSEALKEASEQLDDAIAAVQEMEVTIKRLAGKGALPDFAVEQLVRALDFRLQASLRETRLMLTGSSSDPG